MDKDIAGFKYQYDICVSKFLGFCTKTAVQKDTYDLNDPKVRQQLIDMGFIAVSPKNQVGGK